MVIGVPSKDTSENKQRDTASTQRAYRYPVHLLALPWEPSPLLLTTHPSNLVIRPADSLSKRVHATCCLRTKAPQATQGEQKSTQVHICLPRSLRQTREPHVPRNRCHLLGVTPITTTVLHCCCTTALVQDYPQYHYVYSSKTLTLLHWGLRTAAWASARGLDGDGGVVVQLACGRGRTSWTLDQRASGWPDFPPLEPAAADGCDFCACGRPSAGPALRARLGCFLDCRALRHMHACHVTLCVLDGSMEMICDSLTAISVEIAP